MLWFVGGKRKPNEQCCESVAKNVVDVALFFIVPLVFVVDDSSMIFYFNL